MRHAAPFSFHPAVQRNAGFRPIEVTLCADVLNFPANRIEMQEIFIYVKGETWKVKGETNL